MTEASSAYAIFDLCGKFAVVHRHACAALPSEGGDLFAGGHWLVAGPFDTLAEADAAFQRLIISAPPPTP